MILKYFDQRVLTGVIIVLLLLSNICQIMIGVLYRSLIRETDNMAATENKLLKQCKLKFSNCYQLNMGVINVPVFVDRFLNRIRILGITMSGMGHLAGQIMLLSVLVSGIGICKGIIEGRTVGSLLPYYIVSLFGLYVYFSVSSLIDAAGKKRMLKINLVDYLENHMLNHLCIADVKQKEFEDNKEEEKQFTETQNIFSQSDEKELEELLREFLA